MARSAGRRLSSDMACSSASSAPTSASTPAGARPPRASRRAGRRYPRRFGPAYGLAEELAPNEDLLEAGTDPRLDLAVVAVLRERLDDQAADAEDRARHAAELLVDHQL